MWIAFMSTYPPRACGIATFTSDLVDYFDQQFLPAEETKIIAMNTGDAAAPAADASHGYSKKVMWQISQDSAEDYVRAAREINQMSHVKIVSIQHEFGIFGSDDGKNVLLFLHEIQKPVVVTLHTVLPNPSEHMKEIMHGIIARADKLIAMTQTSKNLLESVFGAPAEKVKVIAHGIHPRPYTDTNVFKSKFAKYGFEDRRIISTFGLLGRGKGIEFGIAAMPDIVKKYPDALYAIIGTTHPVVLKNEGPAYINQLRDQVAELGMENHVVFIDRYVETSELLDFLQATDLYLSLSQNPDQAVSGTLTYALGMGCPVISTPFAQAREIITSELGILVEFNGGPSISNAVISLFDDGPKRDWMSRTAYFRTRSMTWSNVALSYMREFKKLSGELALKEKSIPVIKLDHLRHMTDDFGIFQFAVLTDPDPASGYTIDDNARAMVVACWFAKLQNDPSLFQLAEVYLDFLNHAMRHDETPGGTAFAGFDNYFDAHRKGVSERNVVENLEDANARAVWSLAEIAAASDSVGGGSDEIRFLIEKAKNMFRKVQGHASYIRSPRAIAFHIKALALWLGIEPGDEHARSRIIELAEILADLYRRSQHEGWRWFEESLTYSNGLLSEAMLFAHKATGNEEYKQIGLESLDFLVEHSFDGEMCVPVGQKGWFKLGGQKPLYDQQPEEVSALVLALQTAYEISGNEEFLHKKERAFDWFLGNNILGQVVYSEMSGGCYDGLGEGYVNLNQGAESTTAYLLARAVV